MACGENLTKILHVYCSMDLKMADMSGPNFILDHHGAARYSIAINEISIMEELGVIQTMFKLDYGLCSHTCGG